MRKGPCGHPPLQGGYNQAKAGQGPHTHTQSWKGKPSLDKWERRSNTRYKEKQLKIDAGVEASQI